MKNIIRYTLGLSIVIASSPALPYYAYGAGTLSCGDYVQTFLNPETSHANMYKAWVGGYLTAMNVISTGFTAEDISDRDINGPIEWINNYCRANPMENVANATIAFSSTMIDKRNSANKK